MIDTSFADLFLWFLIGVFEFIVPFLLMFLFVELIADFFPHSRHKL